MASQEELDAIVQSMNTTLTEKADAIQAEVQEISNWIAQQPESLDLTGLVAARDRLAGLDIAGIFTPPATGETSTEESSEEGADTETSEEESSEE